MDKGCSSSEGFAAAASSAPAYESAKETDISGNTGDHYLKHLNKLSHKISKPVNRKSTFDTSQIQQQNQSLNSDQPPPPPPPSQAQAQGQQQPPVYNINKNDFRDVVQKLTGSPAHERGSNLPPVQQPKPQSSRLHRMRPPPLAQISNRPPPLVHPNPISLPQPPAIITNPPMQAGPVSNFSGFGWPGGPLSPLPPFPTVHAAAESPVSAYMRFWRSSVSNFDPNAKQISGFSPLAPSVSPRWNTLNPTQSQSEPPPPLQQHLPSAQHGLISPSTTLQPQSQFQTPSSPLPFGCLNSLRSSPHPLLSPGLLFSPTSGQLGFPHLPLSPTVPVPSPRWRGL